MKKVTKKAQNGSSFDKKVINTIKVNTPYVKSDSVRAKEMSNYANLRAMAKRGSTAAKEPAPVAKARRKEYDIARGKSTASVEKNGGTIKKKK